MEFPKFFPLIEHFPPLDIVSQFEPSGGESVDENRLIDLETKISHQEHLLAQLNEVLTSQQAQIGELQSLCKSLLERLQSLTDVEHPSSGADERPPHY